MASNSTTSQKLGPKNKFCTTSTTVQHVSGGEDTSTTSQKINLAVLVVGTIAKVNICFDVPIWTSETTRNYFTQRTCSFRRGSRNWKVRENMKRQYKRRRDDFLFYYFFSSFFTQKIILRLSSLANDTNIKFPFYRSKNKIQFWELFIGFLPLTFEWLFRTHKVKVTKRKEFFTLPLWWMETDMEMSEFSHDSVNLREEDLVLVLHWRVHRMRLAPFTLV